MTIVFICIDWFLPAYKAGGPIQSIANLVNTFTDDIYYKIFCSNADHDGEILKGVEFDKWTNFNNNTEVWYASSKTKSVSVLKKQVKLSGADVLFVNGIYSWFFNIVPLLFCKANKKIISVRGMLHSGALSQKRAKKKAYLFFWKILRLPRRCYFHASDKDEKIYIQNVFGKNTKIFIAQNFPKKFNNIHFIGKESGKLELISIALVSAMKNIFLVLEALQSCDQQISYNIYGPIKDELYWQKCQDQIKKLPSNILVKYNGDIVPTEVETVLNKSHVFVLPSKSENFGHAIYEALSTGKPVITSKSTPWNNLRIQNAGINANTEVVNEITNAILFFAKMEQGEFDNWRNGAVQYSFKAINIEEIKEQYKKMFLS